MIQRIGALALMVVIAAAALLGLSAEAVAQAVGEGPVNWQLGLQDAADDRMSRIISLHNFVLWIITIICLFVLGLLAWIMIRYNARSNPRPTATTHNTILEVLWTVIPVAILVMIAIPSFRLLYYHDVIPTADLTIKAIGKQWYWSYEYPDNGNFTFDALMLSDRVAAQNGEPRMLGTNNHIIVPVNKTVRVLTTGADVIHAWAMPAFGVKIDAVPGKINATWFRANREGKFYGECSELCGARHAYMPITVEVVSQERFDQWVQEARTKFASVDAPTRVAEERR
jgi:cytochrome c oxidase subunit II